MKYKDLSDNIYNLIKKTTGDVIIDDIYNVRENKILITCADRSDKQLIYDLINKKYPKASPKDKQKGFIVIDGIVVDIISTTAKKANWGHISEGIIAIAIGCRFLHKNKKVTEKKYNELLEKFGKTTNEIKLKSPNQNIKIQDDVVITISIPDLARTQLYTKSQTDRYKFLVKSAIKYANSTNVTEWSEEVYKNNRIDEIKVNAIGKRGGKTDIEVKITDHKGDPMPVNINLSMKSGDIAQFGQAVGSDYETVNSFLSEIFGYEIDAKNVYDNLIQNKKVVEAFQLAYMRVRNKIRKGVDPKKIVKAIKKHATGGDSTVKMVVLGQDTKLLDFEKLDNWVDQHKNTWDSFKEDFYAEYHKTDSGFPKISIKLKGYEGQVLFQVRSRKDQSTSKGNITYRHYIEKGGLLTQLTSVELEEDI